MANKVEVTYNPQLGYLKTVFTHPFDFLTEVQSYSQEQNALELVAGTYQKKTARVRIDLLTETAFRFRMYPYEEKVFENAVFPLEGRQAYSLEDKGECLSLSTGRMELRLKKRPWQLSVLLDGKPLTHENVCDSNVDNMCKYLPIGFDCDGQGNVVKVRETMYMYSDENFYGFGEKFTGFNKRGQVIHCRQSDALSTNTERSYQNIPYFMSSRGYSILLNTYTDNVCDMGVGSGVSYGMEVADKMLDYVMFCDRDYKGLLEGYTALTGRSPMIPKWAFGLWMSKCSYRTQEEVETVARTLREKKIPADVIHIDGWQKMSNSGVWEWDLERFPNPQGMIQTLKDLHFHLSLWMWPYIRVGADSYEFAKEKGYLVMNEKGEVATFHSAATNDFYFAAFDFTNPEMVEWYKGLVKNVVKDGVGVIKTDFSEALPLDAVYHDGSNGLQGHNKLPLLYAKTIYEACAEVKLPAGERPMLWGRSGYAGSQNYPGNWAGDSSTHENNLACVLRSGLSIGLSGVPFWGRRLLQHGQRWIRVPAHRAAVCPQRPVRPAQPLEPLPRQDPPGALELQRKGPGDLRRLRPAPLPPGPLPLFHSHSGPQHRPAHAAGSAAGVPRRLYGAERGDGIHVGRKPAGGPHLRPGRPAGLPSPGTVGLPAHRGVHLRRALGAAGEHPGEYPCLPAGEHGRPHAQRGRPLERGEKL